MSTSSVSTNDHSFDTIFINTKTENDEIHYIFTCESASCSIMCLACHDKYRSTTRKENENEKNIGIEWKTTRHIKRKLDKCH